MSKAVEAKVHWSPDKKKWQVVIQVGEEVIKRWADAPQESADEALRALAVQTAKDEGYDLEAARIPVER